MTAIILWLIWSSMELCSPVAEAVGNNFYGMEIVDDITPTLQKSTFSSNGCKHDRWSDVAKKVGPGPLDYEFTGGTTVSRKEAKTKYPCCPHHVLMRPRSVSHDARRYYCFPDPKWNMVNDSTRTTDNPRRDWFFCAPNYLLTMRGNLFHCEKKTPNQLKVGESRAITCSENGQLHFDGFVQRPLTGRGCCSRTYVTWSFVGFGLQICNDCLNVEGKLLFAEQTCCPGSGLIRFDKDKCVYPRNACYKNEDVNHPSAVGEKEEDALKKHPCCPGQGLAGDVINGWYCVTCVKSGKYCWDNGRRPCCAPSDRCDYEKGMANTRLYCLPNDKRHG